MSKKCPHCGEEINYLCFIQRAYANGTTDFDGELNNIEYEIDDYAEISYNCPECEGDIDIDDLEDFDEEEDDGDGNESWTDTEKPSGSNLIKLDIIK